MRHRPPLPPQDALQPGVASWTLTGAEDGIASWTLTGAEDGIASWTLTGAEDGIASWTLTGWDWIGVLPAWWQNGTRFSRVILQQDGLEERGRRMGTTCRDLHGSDAAHLSGGGGLAANSRGWLQAAGSAAAAAALLPFLLVTVCHSSSYNR